MVLLEDSRRIPYIVASRLQKKKVAVFTIIDMCLSHFVFEERVVKLSQITTVTRQDRRDGNKCYLMALTDKSFEVMDLKYLTEEPNENKFYYKEFFFKFKIGDVS